MSRLYLLDRVRLLTTTLHTELAGAVGARPSLRPLISEGAMKMQTSGRSCRDNTRCHPGQAQRDPGPITRRRTDTKAGTPACSNTAPCGYGSRPSPGRHQLLLCAF